jgi:hypothetical protein
MSSPLRTQLLRQLCTEGDVEGIMERPAGTDDSAKRAREKWYVDKSIARVINR